MNCSNCKIANQNVPCVPQGNDFKIAIVLKEKIKTDGEVSDRDIDILNNQVSVSIIKPNGDAVDNTQNVYSVALNGSTVIISFPKQGKSETGLPKGKYGIEVTGKRSEDSSDFCFSLPIGYAFEIVAYSTQGRFPSDSIITYTVDGVVGVAQNVSSGGGGGSATVGTLKTDNTSAQTPSASESFGGAINLHKVSKTGSYNDLRDKPTIPDVPSWAMQSTKPSYTAQEVGALPSSTQIPTVNNATIALQVNGEGIGNFSLNQSENASINLSGLEKRLQIVKNPTLDNDDLVAQFGRYYVLDNLEDTVTINLPETSSSATVITGLIIYAELPSDGNGGLLFAVDDNEDIVESGLSDIEEGKTYEFNCIWNGTAWAITAVEMKAFTQS